MPVIRSSVRPKTSKQPWGTILKPDELSMGYARHTRYEVDQIVERLYRTNPPRARHDDDGRAQSAAARTSSSASRTRPQSERAGRMTRDQTSLTRDQIDEIVERLSKIARPNQPPEADRRQCTSIYKDSGIVNSFAWRGYNY